MLYLFEGNIGAGKSTLLRRIEEEYGDKFVVIQEPVDEWSKCRDPQSGNSIFELFYHDQTRYGFMFQVYVMETRLKRLLDTIKQYPNKIVLMERSLYSDCLVFADLLHKMGKMTDMEYVVYRQFWDTIVKDLLNTHVKGIVYLYIEPDIALQRIFKRNRKGEESMPLDYIKQLHEQHELWLNDPSKINKPILKLNSNEPIDIHRLVAFLTSRLHVNIPSPKRYNPDNGVKSYDVYAFNFGGVITRDSGQRIMDTIHYIYENNLEDFVNNYKIFDQTRIDELNMIFNRLIADNKKIYIITHIYKDVVEAVMKKYFEHAMQHITILACRGNISTVRSQIQCVSKMEALDLIAEDSESIVYFDDSSSTVYELSKDCPHTKSFFMPGPIMYEHLFEN